MPDPGRVQGLCFVAARIRGVWIAFPAATVLEILGERPWTPIPFAPAHVPGVLGWRGRALGVLDLGGLAGFAEPLGPGERRRRALVLEVGERHAAVLVDDVREATEVAVAPREAQVTSSRYASGEVELAGIPMPVIDVTAALAAVAGHPEAA